jgi:hypothetical protein
MMLATDFPTLSEIRAWDVEHLIKGADHWEGTADQWDRVALQVWQDSHGLDWTGEARDALIERTSMDKTTMVGKSDRLREAANIARRGAGDISAAQRAVLYKVDDAHNAGFFVGEDLSVIDTRSSRTAAERAARQAQAQVFAADIRQRAAQLVGSDHEVAGNLANAASGIGNLNFNEQPIKTAGDKIVRDGSADRRYGVRLVDNTFKQDGPTPTPTPTPPPPPSAPDLGQLQKQINDQQKQINDIQRQLHQPSQPTLGGLAVAAGTGCAGGALVTAETGPGALAGCAVGGGLSGIGYILSKIWE